MRFCFLGLFFCKIAKTAKKGEHNTTHPPTQIAVHQTHAEAKIHLRSVLGSMGAERGGDYARSACVLDEKLTRRAACLNL
jgi:hypothetical protein